MSARRSTVRRVTAAVAAAGVVGLVGIAPAFAGGSGQDNGVQTVNTETVQVYLDSQGDVQSKRVYEQLELTGHGSVDVSNPVSTDGLRNLDGFSGFDVRGHDQVIRTSVDGSKHYRSVSNFDGRLPVSIKPAYFLDGRRVTPGTVVGGSGHLRVSFTVQNLTAHTQQVSYPDGHGRTTTTTAVVPLPLVGSLSTDLPSTFTNVVPGGANTAGDGSGGTTMTWTMTLFPPIGGTTAHLGYSADITDGVVPDVSVNLLPVDPMSSPTFRTAADSYQGGADTGTRLVTGAGLIDDNLLKLRDGAASLLAGLIQLRTGADRLHSGLADTAAPGSRRLADGANRLDAGLGRLAAGAHRADDGSGQVADGARRLSLGAGDALAGSKRLRGGASRLSHGLADANQGGQQLGTGTDDLVAGQKGLLDGMRQLRAGVQNLPADVQAQVNADPQYQLLTGALDQVIAGIGTLHDQPQADPTRNTLLGGLNALKYGLRYPGPADCVNAPATQCGVIDAVQTVKAGLDQQLTSTTLTDLVTSIATSPGCSTDPVCQQRVGNLVQALTGVHSSLQAASAALGQAVVGGDRLVGGIGLMRQKISTGVDPRTCFVDPSQCGALEALQALRLGIPQLVSSISASISQTLLANIGDGAPGCDPAKTLLCASQALYDGGTRLQTGMQQLAAGLARLDAGGGQLADGAGTLSSGLARISGGASRLSTGAARLHNGSGRLAAGASEASSGSGRVADGARQLADGLGSAADGSGRLADGLGQAATGAPRLVDGATRLSTEGMGRLIKAGASTAQDYGQMYAVMQAGAERAHAHSMAFGAPKGALGLTAYSFEMKGDDGESGRNWTRGAAGLAVLGLGGGAFALRRRLA